MKREDIKTGGRRSVSCFLLLAAAVGMIGCGNSTKIKVDKTSEKTVSASETQTVSEGGHDTTDKTGTKETSDPSVDTGDTTAYTETKVTGSETTESETTESKTTGGETYTVNVTGVRLSPEALFGIVGQSAELTVTVLPENATDKRVNITSSDSEVAKISGTTVLFTGKGRAVITVKTVSGSYTAESEVTVSENDVLPNDPRYGENGLPNYRPTFTAGTQYEDFKAVNVKHIFCHDLVAFTDHDGYFYGDCLTVTEFKRILEQLYARDYVLIDIDYMYNYAYDTNGHMTATIKNTIKVPKGKKPIILSVDNVAFPRSEHGLGRADRLEVVNGRLVTYTKMPDGSERYSEEDDVFPILENFIAAHPDFSFSGARCVVAPSGYDGLFGWDTVPGSANYEESFKKAKEVAKWFAEHGYAFACHSYSHRDFSRMTTEEIAADMEKWNNECASIIGKTHVFVYPFGSFTAKDSVQGKALMDAGFSVYCSTSMNGVNWNNFPEVGNAYNERITLSSQLLVTYKDNAVLNSLIDPYTVYENEAHSQKLR